MAFADAVFDGHAVLEGVRAVRAGDLRDLSSMLPTRTVVPVMIIDFAETLEVVRPEDPRADMPNVRGIGERPARIAGGVLQAIETWRTLTSRKREAVPAHSST